MEIFPVTKSGFSLIEVMISFLIISAVGMSGIYITNNYLKNAWMRDVYSVEIIRNIDAVEKIKGTVKTKAQLVQFASTHNDVSVTDISENLCKVVVGDERKLVTVVRVSK